MVARTYIVDASVFPNAFNPYEKGHQDSHRLLAHLQERAAPIIVPTLVLPEVAAAVSRGRQDEELARGFALALSRLPHLVLVPLDDTLARQALELTAGFRLRGSDAVYAAVAMRFGSALIPLDQEQRKRAADLPVAWYPAEALGEMR